ncbi:amino acid adenylation domain-containing protein [Xanthomonas sacchari]|uniref:non-ribosomal peptide synthetase n=1 Tax=Xanthomonas sacchari TaxID=56458 RepID=UPI00225047CE|nr:non-ribosomal peptide synthetase [Xanthomonas sacchari]UYK86711.1 amino acid adenylation domain-containing protein [Xanthomonas sacchari]
MKASSLFPLSLSQRSRWFMYRLSPSEQGRYNAVFAARIQGDVGVSQLSDAFEILARRHPMLRARFVERDGEPMQYVESIGEVPVTSVDAGGWEDEALQARVERDASQAFDLSRSPPIRAHLYRIEPRRCVLLLSLDHMVSDGWSYWRLLGELGKLLSGMELAPLAGPDYSDHVFHQKSWLGSSAAKRQLAYWTRALEGDLPLLDLSFARRDNLGAPDHRSVRADLTLSQVARLRAFCARNAVTPFIFLLTVYQIALHRFNGQADVVVGCPMPARGDGQWDGVIGDFVNVVPMRAHFSADADVTSVLRDARRTALHAIAHQDYPFPELVRTLRLSRTDRHPIFQTMFVFQKARDDDDLHALWHSDQSKVPQISWGELALSPFEVRQHVGVPGIDLSLQSIEVGDMIRCDIGFDAGRLDLAAVGRFAGAFRVLVDGMLQAPPSTVVAALPLLHELERRTVIETFNATSTPWTPGLLHTRFEAQAAMSPDAVALEYGQERVTYAQLDARANRVAHRLRAEGVGPEVLVAICVPRSIEMVVGLLAVLKAGGAYVPLDPAYPHERLAYVLEDSAPLLLLTVHSLDGHLPVTPVPMLWLDDVAEWAELPIQDLPPQQLAPEHLAYVIYTSGSTGRPKGVMITHANADQFIDWTLRAFDPALLSSSVFSTSVCFDLSIFELFAPLAMGGRLLLVDDLLSAQSVLPRATLINTVPSAIAAVLDSGPLPSTIRQVNLAGEPLKGALVKRLFEQSDISAVANLYGPSETTTYSTWVRMTREAGFAQHIGRPIANTRIYILDRHQQPVPIGVAGELLIGGAGVSRGYLGRPDLTAERFLPDPFVPGARMYRTGDLGRWRRDGTIEYLGRNDFQVKIRGFRIELGEIEVQLSACDGVREAVVIAREDVPGEPRLVGYVSTLPGADLPVVTLRNAVAKRLPEYMVPSAFVVLPALPLTPNGKVDRAALPAPGHAAMTTRAYMAPQSEIERALAQIWSELLGVGTVGREDHFFELGGHSLVAARLASRVRALIGVELPLRTVFMHPLLCDLASALAHLRATGETQSPIRQARRSGAALPLSWSQERLWFLDRLDPAASLAYHMPAALRLQGRLDLQALQGALDDLVARHEVLRTCFVQGDDGTPRQHILSRDTGVALPCHDLSETATGAQAEQVARMAAEEAVRPFDLSRDVPIRGRLLMLSPQEHVLLLTQHHVASDAWSVGVLIREVGTLYAAHSMGRGDPLPPLPIQYADYAVWQRGAEHDATLQKQLRYWLEHLTGAPTLLELPTDRPRPAARTHGGADLQVALSASLTARLNAFARQQGVTPFMALLTGWSVLLSRLSGQDEVVIGTPVANRQRSEFEPLIGFFVNTLALRIRLASATVDSLLAQVRADTLSAYAHQDVPFERVVEALQPVRSLGHSPIFQTMLTLDNTPASGNLELSGLQVSPIPQAATKAHFDLSLSLRETGGVFCGQLNYATDLFDAATVRRWWGSFECVLAAMVEAPSAPVRSLPLLHELERRTVIETFNATSTPWTPGLLHTRFEAQAAMSPDAVALEYGQERVTYAQLDARANRVAHRLRAEGVGPEVLVAICVPRSIEMVVGLLAVLKAGGAYVPLDPAYPHERLAYVLEDSAPLLLLTVHSLDGHLPVTPVPMLWLDDVAEWAELPIQDLPPQQLAPEHLAYVIYTSGSTGRPKGVMITHANVSSMIHMHVRTCALGANDRALQFSTFAFDASVEEIFGPLSVGATLVLLPPDMMSYADARFSQYLHQQRITFASLPTVFWNHWAGSPDFAGSLQDADLRFVFIGGEKQDRQSLDAWLSGIRGSDIHLLDAYGPTEATVYVSANDYGPDFKGAQTLGRPLANSRIYIVDPYDQPVPIGVRGELLIGGAQVARGYLGRTDLTSERFVADPFAPGGRVYRTGDLGRWCANGTIEYLGRNDFQVKIRGFRIELGEIEAQLSACTGVREAVVVVREDMPGHRRLVGYLSAQPGAELSAATIRETVAKRLADYMVPSALVVMPALPLTPSGKLDRGALPVPSHESMATRAYAAPSSASEQSLAHIWSALLGIEQVGREDHFFELGGTSLLLVRLGFQIKETFGIELRIAQIYEAATLKDMAALLDAATDRARERTQAKTVTLDL